MTIKQERTPDEQFASDYLAGKACDSMGNKIDGTNSRCSTLTSLLGPMEPVPPPRPAGCADHMDERLVGGTGMPSADDDSHPLNAGRTVPKPQGPQHPNLQRNRLLVTTVEVYLQGLRQGFVR